MHRDLGRLLQGTAEKHLKSFQLSRAQHTVSVFRPALLSWGQNSAARGHGDWTLSAAPSAAPVQTQTEQSPSGGASVESTPATPGLPAEVAPVHPPAAEEPAQRLQTTQTRSYLREIYIKDFALVSEQRLVLQPGFNVVSGESGAGKSVLVGALALVLGGNAPVNCIRAPAQLAQLEARVHLDARSLETARKFLAAQNVSSKALGASGPDGGELLLRREVVKGDRENSVRTRSFVNGVAVTQRILRDIGALLVDVNGQQAAQTLKEAGTQVGLLDSMAATGSIAADFRTGLARLQQVRAELRALDELGDEAARDELQSMVDMIQKYEVQPGEEKELKRAIRELDLRRANVERCADAARQMAGDGESGGVNSLLAGVQATVRHVLGQEQSGVQGEADEEAGEDGEATGADMMQKALDHLQLARRHLAAAEKQAANYARRFQFSPQQDAEMRARLTQVTKLLRKYHCSDTNALLVLAEKASTDLEHWYKSQGSKADKVVARNALEKELADRGSQLSRRRREAAGKLRVAVEAGLADLAMSGSRFDVRIGWDACHQEGEGLWVPEELAGAAYEQGGRAFQTHADGLDRVEYLLAAGPAEPLRALGAVASGGERSRIMLALKAAPAASMSEQSSGEEVAAYGAPILVLDELDSGVGGRLGQPVGRMLQRMCRETSGPSQILCVSHLPQVAACASNHVCVRKGQAEDGRVVTRFVTLDEEQARSQEIADMGGVRLEEAINMMEAAV